MIVARSAAAREVLRCSGLLVGDAAAVGGQPLDVVDEPELLQAGQPAADAGDHVRVPGRFGEYGRGAGVAEDPFDLLGR